MYIRRNSSMCVFEDTLPHCVTSGCRVGVSEHDAEQGWRGTRVVLSVWDRYRRNYALGVPCSVSCCSFPPPPSIIAHPLPVATYTKDGRIPHRLRKPSPVESLPFDFRKIGCALDRVESRLSFLGENRGLGKTKDICLIIVATFFSVPKHKSGFSIQYITTLVVPGNTQRNCLALYGDICL